MIPVVTKRLIWIIYYAMVTLYWWLEIKHLLYNKLYNTEKVQLQDDYTMHVKNIL